MKKSIIVIIVLAVAAIALYSFFKGNYNNMVTKDETVARAWADVQSQYQRRADLIPNLVNTVKGYAEHERETLEGVVEARAKATSIQVDANNLDPAKLQQFQQAQSELSSALSRLLVVVERYPDLKANQNFLELQAQLEGTENRIAVARNRFNEAVQDYNTFIRQFPRNMVAGMFDFERKAMYEADATAQQAPSVQF